ncbi:MAG: hypothetical protein RL375_4205 [Pseudomonadota bacterium]
MQPQGSFMSASTSVSSGTAARRPPVAIPILAESAASGGCGHCHHGDDLPVCAAPLRCAAPLLTGSPRELAQVEHALQSCDDLGGAWLASGLVKSLHAQDGEVAISLLVGSCGAGARLVHAVFDHLRVALPDTDIYVTPTT